MVKISPLETPYSGHFRLQTRFIKPNYDILIRVNVG